MRRPFDASVSLWTFPPFRLAALLEPSGSRRGLFLARAGAQPAQHPQPHAPADEEEDDEDARPGAGFPSRDVRLRKSGGVTRMRTKKNHRCSRVTSGETRSTARAA